MLYYKRKPNVQHIQVFGCVVNEKVVGTNLVNLDDRSRKSIHLGSEPSTKAYKLYDPTCHKIIVSRDIPFDENTNCDDKSLIDSNSTHKPRMFWVHWSCIVDNGEGSVTNGTNLVSGEQTKGGSGESESDVE